MEDGKLRLPKFKKTKKTWGQPSSDSHASGILPEHAVIKNCTVSKHGETVLYRFVLSSRKKSTTNQKREDF